MPEVFENFSSNVLAPVCLGISPNLLFECSNVEVSFASIRALTGISFENLNSLETLNLQNNKLMHLGEDVMEPILDTLRVVDIMGKFRGMERSGLNASLQIIR